MYVAFREIKKNKINQHRHRYENTRGAFQYFENVARSVVYDDFQIYVKHYDHTAL